MQIEIKKVKNTENLFDLKMSNLTKGKLMALQNLLQQVDRQLEMTPLQEEVFVPLFEKISKVVERSE